ncbi:MAG: cytidine deaminase [Clostridia bacterium]|nr:cytidine deaminase [Clostridia bacterium]
MKLEFDFSSALLENAMTRETRSLCLTAADAAEAAEGITERTAIHLLITDDEEIHRLNREYRQTDRATDVLSFPQLQFPGGKTAGRCGRLLRQSWDFDLDACFLGDIVISLDHVNAQAEEYGHSRERELTYLLVHGIFHLFGYDHMTEEEKREMRFMEEKALNAIGMTRITDDELVAMAKDAMQYSYSPYSKFKVGACLLAKSGKTYQGCNIENASYGVSNCAERTALFKAVSEGEREFVKIAIAAEKSMAWPCGICRQALFEFAPDIEVIVACGERRESAPLRTLLPHGFGPDSGMLEILGKDL